MRKFNKFLSLAMAMSLAMSCFVANTFAATSHTATITTESKTTGLVAGDKVIVEVILDSSKGLCAMGYQLNYDPAVFSIDTTMGWMSMKDYAMHENGIDQTWYDEMKNAPTGSILNPTIKVNSSSVNFDSAGQMAVPDAVAAENFKIGKYTFEVKADAANGDYTFSFENDIVKTYTSDDGQTSAALTASPLTVTVGTGSGSGDDSGDDPVIEGVDPTWGSVADGGYVWADYEETDVNTDAYNYFAKFTSANGVSKSFGLHFGDLVSNGGSIVFDIVLEASEEIAKFAIEKNAK